MDLDINDPAYSMPVLDGFNVQPVNTDSYVPTQSTSTCHNLQNMTVDSGSSSTSPAHFSTSPLPNGTALSHPAAAPDSAPATPMATRGRNNRRTGGRVNKFTPRFVKSSKASTAKSSTFTPSSSSSVNVPGQTPKLTHVSHVHAAQDHRDESIVRMLTAHHIGKPLSDADIEIHYRPEDDLDIPALLTACNATESGEADLPPVKILHWITRLAMKVNAQNRKMKKLESRNTSLFRQLNIAKKACFRKFVLGFGTLPLVPGEFRLDADKYGPGCDLSVVYGTVRKYPQFHNMTNANHFSKFLRAFIYTACDEAYEPQYQRMVTIRESNRKNKNIPLEYEKIVEFMDAITRAGGRPMWPEDDEDEKYNTIEELLTSFQLIIYEYRRLRLGTDENESRSDESDNAAAEDPSRSG